MSGTESTYISFDHVYWTWNFLLTMVLVPAVGWWIRRAVSKSDEAATIRLNTIDAKLTAFCTSNTKDHDDLWKAHYAHGHKGLDGEDNEVTSPR